jgi:hypothetical protein
MFFAVRPILLIHGKEIFAVHSRMAKTRRTATAFFPVVISMSRSKPAGCARCTSAQQPS